MSLNLGTAYAVIDMDVSGVLSKSAQAEAALNRLDGAGSGAFNKASAASQSFGQKILANKAAITEVGRGFIALGAAAGVGFGFGIKAAADFQQGMQNIQAVTGATGPQLDKLRQRALQIGKDTKFSAGEAQSAIEELAKAGVSIDDIYNGAADGVANLATATGSSLGTAVNAVSGAMFQFGLSGKDSVRVVDTLARGANAARTDVGGLSDALQYSGGIAHQLGYSLETTTTALVAMNNAGLDASQSGTGLREILTSMVDPGTKAQKVMNTLGISFRDANNQMKPLPQIISEVDQATRGLTDAQKAQYLNQLFGMRGGTAMLALLETQSDAAKKTGRSWQDYYKQVTSGSTAAEQAKTRMDSLQGSLENLRGSLETAAVIAFTAFLGPLKAVVDGINKLVDAFISLPQPIQTALAAILGIVAAAGLIGGTFLLLGVKIAEFAVALQALGGLSGVFAIMRGGAAALLAPLAGLVVPILAIAAAIGLLYLAYKTNFLGFGDLVNKTIAGTEKFVSAVSSAWGQFRQLGQNPVSAALNSIGVGLRALDLGPLNKFRDGIATGLGDAAKFVSKFGTYMGKAFDLGTQVKALARFNPIARGFVGSLGIMTAAASRLVTAFQTGGFKGLAKEIPNTLAHIGDSFQALDTGVARSIKALGNRFKGIKSITDPLSKAFDDAGFAGMHLFHALGDVMKGDWGKAWENATIAGRRFGSELQNLGKAGGAALEKVGDLIQRGVGGAMNALSSRFPAFNGLWDRLNGVLGGVGGVIKNVGQAFQDLAAGDFGGMFKNLGQAGLDGLKALGNAMGTVPSLIAGVFKSIDWGNVGSALQTGLGKASDLAFKGLNAAGGAIARGWNGLTDALRNFKWSDLGSMLQTGLQGASDLAFSALNAAGGALSGAWDWITNAASNIPWMDIANTITGGAAGAVAGLAGAIANGAGDLWGWIKRTASGIDWSGIGSILTRSAMTVGLYILNGLEAGAQAVWGWVKGLGGKIAGLAGDGLHLLEGFGRGIADGLKNGFSSAWNAVSSFIEAQINDLISMINRALAALNKVLRALGQQEVPSIHLVGDLGKIQTGFDNARKSAADYAQEVASGAAKEKAALDLAAKAAAHLRDMVFAPAKAQGLNPADRGGATGPRSEQQQQQGQVQPVVPGPTVAQTRTIGKIVSGSLDAITSAAGGAIKLLGGLPLAFGNVAPPATKMSTSVDAAAQSARVFVGSVNPGTIGMIATGFGGLATSSANAAIGVSKLAPVSSTVTLLGSALGHAAPQANLAAAGLVLLGNSGVAMGQALARGAGQSAINLDAFVRRARYDVPTASVAMAGAGSLMKNMLDGTTYAVTSTFNAVGDLGSSLTFLGRGAVSHLTSFLGQSKIAFGDTAAASAAAGLAIGTFATQAAALAATPTTFKINADNSGALTSIGEAVGTLTASDGLSATDFMLGDNSNAVASIGESVGTLAAADGLTALDFMLGDNSDALGSISEALGSLGDADGQDATTFMLGDNSDSLFSTSEALAALGGADGSTATTIIECIDNVPAAVGEALGALAQAAGASATTTIDVVTRYTSVGSPAGPSAFAKGGIVGYASGGFIGGGSVVMVGERGPELAYLPNGTYIQPHTQSMAALRNARGGNTYNTSSNINVYQQPGESQDALVQRISVELARANASVR